MANKGNNQLDDRVKIRLTVVEYEGSSNKLEHLAQTLANAVRAPVIMMAPPQPQAPIQIPAAPAHQNGHANGAATPVDHPIFEAAPAAEETPPAAKAPGKPKKPKTPEYLSELEFKEGEKPLQAYMDELGCTTDIKRFLAITQWLRKHRSIEEVGANHAYTCYKFFNWKFPDDPTGPFRAMMKKSWVEKGSKPSFFKITHTGENQLIKGQE